MADRIRPRSPRQEAFRLNVRCVDSGLLRYNDSAGNPLRDRRSIIRAARAHAHSLTEGSGPVHMEQRIYEINNGLRAKPEGWDQMTQAQREHAVDPDWVRQRRFMHSKYSAKG